MNELKEIIVVYKGNKMQISEANKIEQAIYFFMNYENKLLSCKSKYGSVICENLKQANDFLKTHQRKNEIK